MILITINNVRTHSLVGHTLCNARTVGYNYCYYNHRSVHNRQGEVLKLIHTYRELEKGHRGSSAAIRWSGNRDRGRWRDANRYVMASCRLAFLETRWLHFLSDYTYTDWAVLWVDRLIAHRCLLVVVRYTHRQRHFTRATVVMAAAAAAVSLHRFIDGLLWPIGRLVLTDFAPLRALRACLDRDYDFPKTTPLGSSLHVQYFVAQILRLLKQTNVLTDETFKTFFLNSN